MKKLIILLILAAAGYWIWRHHGRSVENVTQAIDSGSITAEVLARIAKENPMDLFTVKVSTNRGVVKLSGRVKTGEEREKLGRLAREVQGVKEVRNRLVVDPKGLRTPEEIKNDLRITASIVQRLLKEEGLRGLDIHVESYQGNVVLTGRVPSREQATLAKKLASSVEGVKSVRNYVQVGGS